MRRRFATLAATIVAGGIGAAALASPAQADLTLYQNADYNANSSTAGKYVTTSSNYTYHDGDRYQTGTQTLLRDSVTSFDNITAYNLCFYWDHYYTGASLPFGSYKESPNLGNWGWNDKASSHQFVSC